MKLDDRINLVSLLYQLQQELQADAKANGVDIDETLDEAIRTLICFAD